MKKAIKIVLIMVVVLVALVIGLVVFGLSKIDAIAKEVVERGGTYALQVDTTVDAVDVNLTSGEATMSALRIDNPAGFKTDHFLTLSDTSASVDMGSLRADTIRMPEIRLSGIDVILDKGADPSNYNTILENLRRFESGQTQPPADQQGKKMVIDSLVIEDINIHVANMPGLSLAVGDVAVHIPEITLEHVGEKESMSPAQVVGLVVKTVLAAAVEAGGGIIPADVLGELGNGLSGLSSLGEMGIDAISDLDLEGAIGDVSEQINKAAGDVRDQIDKASKDVQDQIDDAANDIKGILGGKKKSDDEDDDEP